MLSQNCQSPSLTSHGSAWLSASRTDSNAITSPSSVVRPNTGGWASMPSCRSSATPHHRAAPRPPEGTHTGTPGPLGIAGRFVTSRLNVPQPISSQCLQEVDEAGLVLNSSSQLRQIFTHRPQAASQDQAPGRSRPRHNSLSSATRARRRLVEQAHQIAALCIRFEAREMYRDCLAAPPVQLRSCAQARAETASPELQIAPARRAALEGHARLIRLNLERRPRPESCSHGDGEVDLGPDGYEQANKNDNSEAPHCHGGEEPPPRT